MAAKVLVLVTNQYEDDDVTICIEGEIKKGFTWYEINEYIPSIFRDRNNDAIDLYFAHYSENGKFYNNFCKYVRDNDIIIADNTGWSDQMAYNVIMEMLPNNDITLFGKCEDVGNGDYNLYAFSTLEHSESIVKYDSVNENRKEDVDTTKDDEKNDDADPLSLSALIDKVYFK